MTDDADGYAIAQLGDALHEAEAEIVRLREALTAAEAAVTEIVARVEKWNLEQYHCDYLALCLNSGTQPVEWAPHAGERSQARADAERLVAALVADGLIPAAAVAAASDGEAHDG